EGERRGEHAPVAKGDELGQAPLVALLDQPDGIGSVGRRSPDRVGAARAPLPRGLAPREELLSRRMRGERRRLPDGGPRCVPLLRPLGLDHGVRRASALAARALGAWTCRTWRRRSLRHARYIETPPPLSSARRLEHGPEETPALL